MKYIIIIRKKNNYIIKKGQQSDFNTEKDGEILFYIRKSFKTGSFELINPVRKKMIKNIYNIDNLNFRPWLIVNSKHKNNEIDNEDYNLNENDIIKIDGIKYEVIKKNINSYNNILPNESQDNYNISEMNRIKGSIFDIDLKPNQYIVTEKEKGEKIKTNEEEQKNGKKENNHSHHFFYK